MEKIYGAPNDEKVICHILQEKPWLLRAIMIAFSKPLRRKTVTFEEVERKLKKCSGKRSGPPNMGIWQEY